MKLKCPESVKTILETDSIKDCLLFEMVSNWADHARKDAKTRKKAYEEAVAAHDHDMGVTPLHKNMAVGFNNML